jgi:hypothetical protein
MTIEYSIEVPGCGTVNITQTIDGCQSPTTTSPPKDKTSPAKTSADRADVMLPAHFEGSPSAGSGKNNEGPGTGGGRNNEGPGTGGSGGGKNKQIQGGVGTGDAICCDGFTIVLGPVVLLPSCPHCKEDGMTKNREKVAEAHTSTPSGTQTV